MRVDLRCYQIVAHDRDVDDRARPALAKGSDSVCARRSSTTANNPASRNAVAALRMVANGMLARSAISSNEFLPSE
jgi:hypothetical protein